MTKQRLKEDMELMGLDYYNSRIERFFNGLVNSGISNLMYVYKVCVLKIYKILGG